MVAYIARLDNQFELPPGQSHVRRNSKIVALEKHNSMMIDRPAGEQSALASVPIPAAVASLSQTQTPASVAEDEDPTYTQLLFHVGDSVDVQVIYCCV